MTIKWDESLVLGIEEIDQQHRSLIEHFEKLSEVAQQGKAPDEIEGLTEFLFEYAQMHFTAEDRLMTEHRYPKIETQRQEHGEFTRDANEFRKRIKNDGATRELALNVTGRLIKWIIQHIRNHDREMVTYLKESMALRQKYSGGIETV